MHRRRFSRLACSMVLVGILAMMASMPVFGQVRPRDYAITSVGYSFNEDDNTFFLEVTVTNNGGDAVESTTIEVLSLDPAREGEVLAEQDLVAIVAGGQLPITIEFSMLDFAPGSVQPLSIHVGIDEYELNGSSLAQNNTQNISVPIPEYVVPDAPLGERIFSQNADGSYVVLGNRLEPDELLLAVLAVVGVFIMLWLLSIILRLIFRRPPRMERWDPPYGHVPPLDPNSLDGRRYEWQRYAMNGGLYVPPQEGAYHAIKLLLGEEDNNLGNWSFSGLRLSQYDQYGMVNSTNTVASRKLVKKLTRITRRSDALAPDQMEKRLRPIARQMVRAFRKNISKKTFFLPVEVDMRFVGKHGEIKILFELYQLRQGGWYRLDQWEPEMQVIGQDIHESYRYTIHGRVSGEKVGDFYKRLETDLLLLLTETIHNPIIAQRAQPKPLPVREKAPDTISGLTPVTDQHPAVS
ncbi:MAG: hypothetical protein H6670_16315 [Anaerolineaceae bacterium]|nr:hypothetical protein [Anaerolineaceae bacterium]